LLLGSACEMQASSGDVPLMLHQRRNSSRTMFSTSLGSVGAIPWVIEAYVDANGRVEDYRTCRNPMTSGELPEVKEDPDLHHFPAGSFSWGRPTSGRAVISSPRSA